MPQPENTMAQINKITVGKTLEMRILFILAPSFIYRLLYKRRFKSKRDRVYEKTYFSPNKMNLKRIFVSLSMEGFFKALSNRQGDRKSNGTMDFSHGGG